MDERRLAPIIDEGVRKFATVFLILFLLGIVLAESFPEAVRQEAMKLGVVFGVCVALLGAVIGEEQLAIAARALQRL